jgi:DNA-binding LacI/PurR family transcriptional regulator
MVRQRSYVVGVMVSNLHNPFFADVIDGIDVAVTEAGYRAILTTGNRVPERELLAVATLLEMRVDGLILASPVVPRSHVIEASQAVPTVTVGKATRASTIDSVSNDDRRGGEMVVDQVLNGEGLNVPGDISVVGYDNTALAAGHRSGLTTVDQPRHDMGRMAAELILERISTDRTTVRYVALSPKLVARESSGPPRS